MMLFVEPPAIYLYRPPVDFRLCQDVNQLTFNAKETGVKGLVHGQTWLCPDAVTLTF